MLQFEELKRQLEEQESALEELGQALGLEKLREEVDMLEHKSAEPGFWDNMEQAQKVTQRMAALKAKDESYQKLRARAEDCLALIEMGDEAKKRGATVIGITSDHYRDAPSRDKQGRHLRDVCDFYINNHVPHGDAVVGVGEDVKAGPVSSISGFFIANSIILAACEELSRRGFTPPVFKSGNVAGGDSYNSQILGRYMSRIKHL